MANYLSNNTFDGTNTFVEQIISNAVAAPLAVTSTALNVNFNADYLDGLHASSFMQTSAVAGVANTIAMFTGAASLGVSPLTVAGNNVTGAGSINALSFISNAPILNGSSVTGYSFYNGTLARWVIGKNGLESTGNAGANLTFSAFDDAGAFLRTPFNITRSTGNIGMGYAVTIGQSLLVSTTLSVGATATFNSNISQVTGTSSAIYRLNTAGLIISKNNDTAAIYLRPGGDVNTVNQTIFNGSGPSISVTGGDSDKWNTAYGWGNHALAGYAPASSLSGYVPVTRTLTINGDTKDLTVNQTWTISTGTGLTGTLGAVPYFDTTSTLGSTPLVYTNMLLSGAVNMNLAGYVLGRELIADNPFAAANITTGLTITNNSAARWALGRTGAESSGNAGSLFALTRYGDNGMAIDNVFTASRVTGLATFTGYLTAPYFESNFPQGLFIRGLTLSNAGSIRWIIGKYGTESTGNAGSDLLINRFDDTGTNISTVFTFSRSTGIAIFAGIVRGAAPVGGTDLTNKTYVDGNFVPTSRTITINGDTKPLTGNVSWTLPAGTITGGGTLNVLPVFTGSTALGDSPLTLTPATGRITSTGGITALTFISNVAVVNASDVNGYGFYNATLPRWVIGKNGLESTGNAGSNLLFSTFDDAGGFLRNALSINRASGAVNTGTALTVGTTLTVTGAASFSNTITQNTSTSSAIYRLATTGLIISKNNDTAAIYLRPGGDAVLTNQTIFNGTGPSISVTGGDSDKWNTAYGWGSHVAAGYTPQTRKLTINGTQYDLSADRVWTIATGSTISGTAGKISYFATSSTLGDSPLTVSGGNVTSAGDYFGFNYFSSSTAAGTDNGLVLALNGVPRWAISRSGAEPGAGNPGSSLLINSYSNAGGNVDTVIMITRDTVPGDSSGIISMLRRVYGNFLTPVNDYELVTKSYVDSKVSTISGTASAVPYFATASTLGSTAMTYAAGTFAGTASINLNGTVSGTILATNNTTQPALGAAPVGINILQNNTYRWIIGRTGPESTGNAGSLFTVGRFADNGTLIDNVLTISRVTGYATFSATVGAQNFENNFPQGTSIRGISFTNSGSARWVIGKYGTESTGNAGSDLYINRFDDAGVNISTVFTMSRATGIATFAAVTRGVSPVGGTDFTTKAYVDNLVSGYVPTSRTITINGDTKALTANVSWTVSGGGTGTVTQVGLVVPTGFDVTSTPVTTSGNLQFAYTSGYSLPTTANQSNWSTAYGWGNHASAGYTPQTRKLSINGVQYDLSADRAWTVSGGSGGAGTVTQVGLMVPTGFDVLSTPVTTSGNLQFGFTSGYSLPTTAKQTAWDAKPTGGGTAAQSAFWSSGSALNGNSNFVDNGTEFLFSKAVGFTASTAVRNDFGVWQTLYVGSPGTHGRIRVHNDSGAAPAANAAIEISSTTKGFINARMTYVQRLAIPSPEIGLEVYQTNDAPVGGDVAGKYIFMATGWRRNTVV